MCSVTCVPRGCGQLGCPSTANPHGCALPTPQALRGRVNAACPARERSMTQGNRDRRTQRVPPHNLQAEESLLGAMLLSKDAIAAGVELLGGRRLLQARARPHLRRDHLALRRAASRRIRSPWPTSCAGPGCSTRSVGKAPSSRCRRTRRRPRAPARYAKIVEEHALLRRMIWVAGDIAERAYALPDDVEKTIDEAESMVFAVAERRLADTTSLDRRPARLTPRSTRRAVRAGRVDHRDPHRLLRARRVAVRARSRARSSSSVRVRRWARPRSRSASRRTLVSRRSGRCCCSRSR